MKTTTIHTGIYSNNAFNILTCVMSKSIYNAINRSPDGEILFEVPTWHTDPISVQKYRNDIACTFRGCAMRRSWWPNSYKERDGELLYLFDLLKGNPRRINRASEEMRKTMLGQPLDPIAAEAEAIAREQLDKLKEDEDVTICEANEEYLRAVADIRRKFRENRNAALASMAFPEVCK